jgi:hypothetical protein
MAEALPTVGGASNSLYTERYYSEDAIVGEASIQISADFYSANPELTQIVQADEPPPLPSQPPSTTARPQRVDTQQYYLAVNGANGQVRVGPLTVQDVITRLKNNTVKHDSLVWSKDMTGWSPVCSLETFKPVCGQVADITNFSDFVVGKWSTNLNNSAFYKFDADGYGMSTVVFKPMQPLPSTSTFDDMSNMNLFPPTPGFESGEMPVLMYSWSAESKGGGVILLKISPHGSTFGPSCLNGQPCLADMPHEVMIIDNNTFQDIKSGETFTRAQ